MQFIFLNCVNHSSIENGNFAIVRRKGFFRMYISSSIEGVPVVSQVDHLLQVLQVLCEYQSVLPDVFRRHVVNFGLLLEGVRGITTSDDTSEDQGSLLQLHLLRLLAESSVRQLSWMQEVGL